MSSSAEPQTASKKPEDTRHENTSGSPVPEHTSENDGGILSRAFIGTPGEPPIDGATRFLGNSTFSHPFNNGLRTTYLKRAQQTYGNRFVQRAIAGTQRNSTISVSVQRSCACGGTCDACSSTVAATGPIEQLTSAEPKPGIQAQAVSSNGLTRPKSEDQEIIPKESRGQPLDEATREIMESRFGADFSHVRVHTDTPAVKSAKALNAHAYTFGHDIFFTEAKYSPQTREGQRLIAHELTHTVQQAEALMPSNEVTTKGHDTVMLGRADDPLEQEADRVADTVVSGDSGSSPSLGGQVDAPTMQRQEAPSDKPREQPTKFPPQEEPKQGKEKEEEEKDKLAKAALKAAGEFARRLWDEFSNSEPGKSILAANEKDLTRIAKFFEDFASTVLGKIALGVAAGGAATGAFLGARSAGDGGGDTPSSTTGQAPGLKTPKDEKFFALELNWDFVTPPAGFTFKTPWLDLPKIGGSKSSTPTSPAPAPQLIRPTLKIPRICTPADPGGDRGEAAARDAQIYSWLLWKRQQDEKQMNEILRQNIQTPGEIWQPGTYPKIIPQVTPLKPLFKRVEGADPIVGQDLAFGAGEYVAHGTERLKLFSHELTHVVRRHGAGNSNGHVPSVSDPSDSSEHEASRVAQAIVKGVVAGPVLKGRSARLQREAAVCELPHTTIGTFELDPALTNIAIPLDMTAHVRISQPMIGAGRGLFRDRFVELVRPVRSATRLTAYAVPIEHVMPVGECTGEPVSHMLAAGDQAQTAHGTITVTHVKGGLVFTAQPNGDTVGAGAVVFIETDAGTVVIDAGLQVSDPQYKQAIGSELGRQIGEHTKGHAVGEAIISTVTADGPSLPYIAAVVGLRSVRATQDLYDDGTVAAVLSAQDEYRRWYEASLRERLIAGRAEWESTQPISPNQGIRDQLWEAHVTVTVAAAMREVRPPTIGTATETGGVLRTDEGEEVAQFESRPGEIPDVSGTRWEPVHDQRVFVYGGGRLAMVPSRGLVQRPTRPPAQPVAEPAHTAVPNLQPSGPVGLPAATARPVTPWMLLATVGKEGMVVVRSGAEHLFLIDAGGPRSITIEGMASLTALLGGGLVERVLITHEHSDHVHQLAELIVEHHILPENLVISELWPDVIDTLRTMEKLSPELQQRLRDLGYGEQWTGPRQRVTGEPVIRARVRAGPQDVEILGLSPAHREHAAAQAAERSGGRRPDSSVTDRASFVYIFGNESSSNRTLVLGDFRGENIVELYNEMGEVPFRSALRNVRSVVGAGHHFSHAAGRRAVDVRGLELLIRSTLIQNGELTIYVQSRTSFAFLGESVTMAGPEGALLRYFVRQGARVVFVGAGEGGAMVESSAGVSTFGTGAEVIPGDPRVVEMHRRLEVLREARRTVAESAEFGPRALGMEGRPAADILAGLNADIARLEGLAGELSGHAGADLLDVRGPQKLALRGPKFVAERRAYREQTTRPGRTADQVLADMAVEGPAEQTLTQPVRERLRLAVASGRSVALDVEFARTPTNVATAIEAIDPRIRSQLTKQYGELAELASRLESGLVPPAQRLEFLARATVLRNALTEALTATTGSSRTALEAEMARISDVIARLEAGTERRVEVGRDIEGRLTRTEYIRLRRVQGVERGFHELGRAMGALMVVHSVSELGTMIDDAARGDLTIPEGALRVAHAAYGMNIGVRLASQTFRQARAGVGGVAMREFALLAVLEIGATAFADYDDWESRAAATLGTAIHSSVNLICMAAGAKVMALSTRLGHPLARGVGMGLGLAIMMAGETILKWLGLDEAVERWTSFPPGEVTNVHQEIGASLHEYRILIGTQQVAARSDAEITGLGLADPARVRELASSTGDTAAQNVRSKERELTALFDSAYRRARDSWVGLQILDEQAEEFTRLRGMAMSGRDDPGRADLDTRWRALDASLDLSGADETAIRGMEQWGKIDDWLDNVAGELNKSSIDFGELFESMEKLQLVMDNARYRIDAPTRRGARGVLRPRSMIEPGTTAFRVYEELLSTREARLAILHGDLARASGGTRDGLTDISLDPQTTLARLRAVRRTYDAQVTAAAAENPTLALPATWQDPAVLAQTAVAAYRAHPQTFERLRLAELTLQSAGRQTEITLTVANSPPPEALLRLARAEIDGVPAAIFARRMTHGLVFPHELDAVLEERGAEEDAILATRMDVAFPRGGVAPATAVVPPTEMEIEALRAGDLASMGRRITTTERQLGEVRRIVAPGRTWKPGEPVPGLRDIISGRAPDIWNQMGRAIAHRQFAVLNSSYRIVDFEWNNTYPSRTVVAGRSPIVGLLNDSHHGCDSEYCFGGPLMYYRVIAVNADAVAQLGPEPVYINGFRELTNEEIDQRLGAPAKP